MSPRRILVSGLPSGCGCSMVAASLAHCLNELERRVALVGPLADLPARLHRAPAARGASLSAFGLGGGAAYLPLELLQPPGRTQALRQQPLDCDFLLLDRFTGLAVAGQEWYDLADEVLLVVDLEEGRESKSLHLAARICAAWPDLPLYVLLNRTAEWPDWQVLGREFNRKTEKICGRRFPVLGGIPITIEMERAARERISFAELFPNHPATRILKQAARQLLHMEVSWAHDPQVLVHSPNRGPARSRVLQSKGLPS